MFFSIYLCFKNNTLIYKHCIRTILFRYNIKCTLHAAKMFQYVTRQRPTSPTFVEVHIPAGSENPERTTKNNRLLNCELRVH